MMKYLPYALPLLFIAFSCNRSGEDPDITRAELFQHLSYLASDSLKGRYPGTPEDSLAATYIAGEFRKAGLQWLTRNGLQSFEVITDLEKGKANYFHSNNFTYTPDADFSPFPFSANKSVEAEVVFAGYGFDIQDSTVSWNDYHYIQPRDKWVMVLRGNAEIDSSQSPFHIYSNERDKAMLAQDKGAAGILFVSGPVFDPDDQLVDLDRREGKISIPAIHIKRTVADRILAGSGRTVRDLELQLNRERKTVSFRIPVTVNASAEVLSTEATTYNAIGYLEGSDPEKKNNIIIVGAHYDHLGMGGPGSSSRRPDTLAVHNGADDNASGVAALIEIAEKLSLSEYTPSHSFLFIAFGAEEMGLVGSKHYTEHPLLPLGVTKLMLNMDMVGRLRDYNLQVGGVGTSIENRQIVEDAKNSDSLELGLTMEGYGASDHSSFYFKDIPVLFITTGAHSDYHTPDDDVDNLNLAGMVRVASYTENILLRTDQLDSSLTFQEAGPRVRYSGRSNHRITLGIMPDFTDTDDRGGMRVDFVTPGKPAYHGGMKKGDYIIAIEGKPVNGIYDYMYRLSKASRGQVIIVTVKRDQQKLDLIIQL